MELELTFNEDIAPGTTSHWDKIVPIIAKGDTVYAYLPEEVYSVGNYCELCHTLEHTDAKEVRLVMNNGGGDLYAMLSIAEAVRKSNAKVVAQISGCVASAATMLTLCCDEIEVAKHTSWLTHYYSGGTAGKGNEIKARNAFDEIEIPRMFRDIHKGFLTDDEIERVIDGKDLWMSEEEILRRWESKV